jgi:DNA polymerase-3 subunit gamma/tau
LLDSVIEAFATHNSAEVFASVDSVIQTGQDPRRFVEDLLERLRDLVVVLAVGTNAHAVMRGVPADELDKLTTQAFQFGMSGLTHASNVVSETLDSMSGATSPRLQLELMCAKVLVPAADEGETGSLARIERLERRIGMGGGAAAAPAQAPAASAPSSVETRTSIETVVPTAVVEAPAAVLNLNTQAFKDAWPDILQAVNKQSKSVWMVAFTLQVIDYDATSNVLTLQFLSARDLDTFKGANNSPEILRNAIDEILGVTVKFKPQFVETQTTPIAVVSEPAAAAPVESPTTAVADTASEDTEDVSLLEAEAEKVAEPAAAAPAVEKPKAKSRNSKMVDEEARYGESMLREVLGAEPVEDKKNGR